MARGWWESATKEASEDFRHLAQIIIPPSPAREAQVPSALLHHTVVSLTPPQTLVSSPVMYCSSRKELDQLLRPRRWGLSQHRRPRGMSSHHGMSSHASQAQRRLAGALRAQLGGDPQDIGSLADPEAPARPLGQQRPLDLNVWAYKPAWCQPWSIVGTGAAFVVGVWAISGKSVGWTTASTLPVIAWWYLFLVVMPVQFREYAEGVNRQLLIEQRRRQQGDWEQI